MTALDAARRRPSVAEEEGRWLFWDGSRTAPTGWQGFRDLSADELVSDGLPVGAGVASQVYVGPSIGRIDGWNVPFVLEELRRTLLPGGVLRLEVYDLDAAVDAYRRADVEFFWDPSSGLSEALSSQLLEYGAARTLFTADLVERILVDAGFTEVTEVSDGAVSVDAPRRAASGSVVVEAVNPTAWPQASEAPGISALHLGWADRLGRRVRVGWSAPARSQGRLAYRVAGSGVWGEVTAQARPTADGIAGRWVFHADTADLLPDQGYEYEVRQTSDEVDDVVSGHLRTPPATPGSPLRLAFVADTGLADRPDGLSDGVARVVDEVVRRDPHAVLGGGDYAYRSSDPRWETGQQAVHAWIDQMGPLLRSRPLMAQFGNHEVALRERHRDWAAHFAPPEQDPGGCRSFSFDIAACHVVAFYAPTADIDPAEVSWLWEDLSRARSRPEAPWLVVFQHQPLIAHGSSHPADRRVNRALHRVLEANAVDLHLSAHDQNYERTHPVVWVDGVAVASGSGGSRHRRGVGTVLAKVGPGGKRSDRGGDFSRLPARPAAPVAVSDASAHHIAVLEVTDRRLVLECVSIPDRADPVVIDRVEILR
jgi:hypothetical protein